MSKAIGWLGLQSAVDHLRHLIVRIGARAAGAQFIVQSSQARLPVALAPLANAHPRHPHPLGDGGVGLASRADQAESRPR